MNGSNCADRACYKLLVESRGIGYHQGNIMPGVTFSSGAIWQEQRKFHLHALKCD